MKLILFLLFLGLSTNLICQSIDSTLIFNFDQKNSWAEWKNTNSACEIVNGTLEVEHKRSEGCWGFWNYIKHDENEIYEIETKIKHKDGKDNYGYGIIFGFEDWNNYNAFMVSKNGSICAVTKTQKEYKEPFPWEKNKNINADGDNILKISLDDKNIVFYLNGKEVFKTKKSKFPIHSQNYGLIVYNQMIISADYFSVKGKFKPIKLVSNAIKGYKKELLSDQVNSSTDDLCPRVTSDGKTLYFFRKEHKENIGGKGKDDIWFSNLNDDGTWTTAKNLGNPINNDGHNFIISVMSDNNQMVVANTYNTDGTTKGSGFSISNRTIDGWSIPTELKVTNYYNDSENSSHSISHDKQYFIMAITRKDSKGKQDLYVSKRNIIGEYSEPKNLGSVINTEGNEVTPFLASDNKTLYFSSDGHPGYGDNDIFVTKRLDDTWENWSEPLNLGPEINTSDWDAYFSIPASGDYAYMTESNEDNDNNIVRIKLSESAKPNPVALISGTVFNKKDNSTLGAHINYTDMETNQVVGEAESNPLTGKYTIVLEYGKKYSFKADKDAFYAVNDYLDLTEIKSYQEVKKDLFLVPVEIGQVVRLNNIFFDLNKADIKDESAGELNRLVDFLNKNKSVTIEIGGHTDDQGADAYNKNLSNLRAESVVNYLIQKGIEKSRLTYKGYGENKPLVKNDTDENRAINRRVEFTILKQ